MSSSRRKCLPKCLSAHNGKCKARANRVWMVDGGGLALPSLPKPTREATSLISSIEVA